MCVCMKTAQIQTHIISARNDDNSTTTSHLQQNGTPLQGKRKKKNVKKKKTNLKRIRVNMYIKVKNDTLLERVFFMRDRQLLSIRKEKYYENKGKCKCNDI